MSPTTRPGSQGEPACSTRRSTSRATKRPPWFGRSTPGRRPASHSTWKPLQMPSTGPPAAASLPTTSIAGERRAIAPGRRWSPYENPPGTRAPSRRGGSASRCHTRTASAPISSTARTASRSSHEPGNEITPMRGRALTGAPPRSSRSDRSRAPARRRSSRSGGASAGSSTATSRSKTLPARTPSTGRPRPERLRAMTSPCGSRMPGFGRTSTITRIRLPVLRGRRRTVDR